MPLVKRTIEPVEISRNRVAPGIKNELDFVTNGTLGNVIRQLSSLSKHVEDIFNELHHESCSLFNRTCQLSERIDRLKVKITQLNPTVEEVLLQDINMRKPFKSSIIKDQQVITLATRPHAVTEVYKRCEPPPALQKLNPYRHDGKDSLKFYTEPGYFFELWCQAMQKDTKCQMKRHKRIRRPHRMTDEPPKAPTNPCPENRKFLHDAEHLIDATYKYGYVQYLDGQMQPNVIDMKKPREFASKAVESQMSEHIRNEASIHDSQEIVINSVVADNQYPDYVADTAVVTNDVEQIKPVVEVGEQEKCIEDVIDTAAEIKLLRPNSLELPTPVNNVAACSADLEDINARATITGINGQEEASEKTEDSFHSKYSISQPVAVPQIASSAAPEKIAEEPVEPTRTSLPPCLNMCKATVEIPTTDKELSLLVEVVSSKHMSGAKVSSSSILSPRPVPSPVAAVAASAAAAELPSPEALNSPVSVSDVVGKDLLAQTSPKSNVEVNKTSQPSSLPVSPGHSISVISNSEQENRGPDEAFWNDALPAELTTKSSTPDSVDLPPPPSPPPPFSQTPDSPSLVSLPPLPPPPLEETDDIKVGNSSIQPALPVPMDKMVDSSCNLLPNGNVQYFRASLYPSVSSATSQADAISTISECSLVTNSSGSTTRSEGGTAVASDQPLVRDTRCDLLAAIREGIKLRKVEERRQKTEQKHLPTRRLDVQTIMEAAFEMRRKVLEENDSEEEEDEFDSNWSEDD